MSADPEHPGHPESDAGGDYGYDLAHEVSAALDDIPRSRGTARVPLTSSSTSASITVDLHGDLGYDSAHERGS